MKTSCLEAMNGFNDFLLFLRNAPVVAITESLRTSPFCEDPVLLEKYDNCATAVNMHHYRIFEFQLPETFILYTYTSLLGAIFKKLVLEAVKEGYLETHQGVPFGSTYIPTLKVWDIEKTEIKNIGDWFYSLDRPWTWFSFEKKYEGINFKSLLTSGESQTRKFAKIKLERESRKSI